jgi:hypothetical protein
MVYPDCFASKEKHPAASPAGARRHPPAIDNKYRILEPCRKFFQIIE